MEVRRNATDDSVSSVRFSVCDPPGMTACANIYGFGGSITGLPRCSVRRDKEAMKNIGEIMDWRPLRS
jgi:hypothetical protein